jgi:PAS domain S-box-containing protein
MNDRLSRIGARVRIVAGLDRRRRSADGGGLYTTIPTMADHAGGIPAGDLHLRLLEQFAPPSLVVTEEHTIVHVSENGGRFLRFAGGEPSRDVKKLIHPALRVDLRTALHMAGQQRSPVEVRSARLPVGAGEAAIRIIVRPVLHDGIPPRGYFLIMFDEERPSAAPTWPAGLHGPATTHVSDEEELERAGAQLHLTVERRGTEAEALRSIDEERPAVNQKPKVELDELRQADDDLRAGDRRLRLLVDTTIDYAIFTMNPDGRINYWNSGAERMFGYEVAEILGRDMAILFTPEDRAAGVPQEELAQAARAGRASDERWHLRQNGDRFFCSGVTTRLGDGGLVGFARIARDLTDRQQADTALRAIRAELEDRVKQRTAELQAEVTQYAAARHDVTTLLHRVVTAQEEERARIARDLHDQLGQQLTALRMALERHAEHCPSDGPQDVQRALALTREIDTEVDFLAWELRPAVLDDLGIVAALPRFLDEWSGHYGIRSHFAAANDPGGVLSREAEVTIYRVAQEALNNIVKHAHASRVDVLLERRDHSVVLVVEDDGVGFDTQDPATNDRGIGLAGMRERAALIGAELQIESQPGATTLFLRCPIGEASRWSAT